MARPPRLPVPIYHNLVCHCSMAARVSKMADGEFIFALASDGFTKPTRSTQHCVHLCMLRELADIDRL
jgi:hypothetical protein